MRWRRSGAAGGDDVGDEGGEVGAGGLRRRQTGDGQVPVGLPGHGVRLDVDAGLLQLGGEALPGGAQLVGLVVLDVGARVSRQRDRKSVV